MDRNMGNDLTFDLMKEYYDKVNNYCYKDGKPLTKNNKMAGNIFAMIIEKYIRSIIEKNKLMYKVSCNNSYINGCSTEWDLLIVKDKATDNEVNIYNASDVKCIIELKTASHFFSEPVKGKSEKEREKIIEKDFKKIFDNIPNGIRYLYISLFQNPNRGANCIKEVVQEYNNKNDTVFFFIENTSYNEEKIKESIEKREIDYIKTETNFEDFIIKAVKD